MSNNPSREELIRRAARAAAFREALERAEWCDRGNMMPDPRIDRAEFLRFCVWLRDQIAQAEGGA